MHGFKTKRASRKNFSWCFPTDVPFMFAPKNPESAFCFGTSGASPMTPTAAREPVTSLVLSTSNHVLINLWRHQRSQTCQHNCTQFDIGPQDQQTSIRFETLGFDFFWRKNSTPRASNMIQKLCLAYEHAHDIEIMRETCGLFCYSRLQQHNTTYVLKEFFFFHSDGC